MLAMETRVVNSGTVVVALVGALWAVLFARLLMPDSKGLDVVAAVLVVIAVFWEAQREFDKEARRRVQSVSLDNRIGAGERKPQP